MSKLYLVRHAQASLGSDNYDRLSPTGIKQTQILANYLKELAVKFDAIYSGEMERQKDTARAVISTSYGTGEASELRIAREFNEYAAHSIIEYQVPEMLREDPTMAHALANLVTDGRSMRRVFERAILAWVSGRCRVPGVETWQEFVQRVRSGVTRVMAENGPGKSIAVFTSGGAICASMQMALGLPNEQTILLALQTLNTGVSVFHHSEGRLSLLSFNSVAHLELCKDPELITYR